MASAVSTFVFADLAGFTALTEAHGDVEAIEIATAFAGQVRCLLPEYGAEEIKTIGDEVMIRVVDPEQAVRLGLRIVAELASPGSPPVRVGMHSGPAIGLDGDWFGGTVNLASRVVGAAKAGEVLLTEDTGRQAGHAEGLELEDQGRRYFRHLPEPVPVYRALESGDPGRELEVDPVCRMAVDPSEAAGSKHRRGLTYYFCS
ncbi:MAG: adenylate/guanylate cyclase domain-containing protein, partial [Solirubrobacterales bacterium]